GGSDHPVEGSPRRASFEGSPGRAPSSGQTGQSGQWCRRTGCSGEIPPSTPRQNPPCPPWIQLLVGIVARRLQSDVPPVQLAPDRCAKPRRPPEARPPRGGRSGSALWQLVNEHVMQIDKPCTNTGGRSRGIAPETSGSRATARQGKP